MTYIVILTAPYIHEILTYIHVYTCAYTQPLTTVLGEDMEMADVRRAVSFILDYYHLLTPSCLVLTLKSVSSYNETETLQHII